MGAGLHYLVVMTAEGYQDKGFLFLCKGGVERGASTGLRFLEGILGNGMGGGPEDSCVVILYQNVDLQRISYTARSMETAPHSGI